MEREIQLNKTQYIGDLKVTAQGDRPLGKRVVGNTAEHEAMHVVAAILNGTSIDSATIIPGPGYLGLTKLSRADAVSAMAPHSMGKSGTGHDVRIAAVIGSSGAESAARGIIGANLQEVEEVAWELDNHGTIGHGDAVNAMRNARVTRFKSGMVTIQNKDGEQVKIEGLAVNDGAVLVREEVIIFQGSNKNPKIH